MPQAISPPHWSHIASSLEHAPSRIASSLEHAPSHIASSQSMPQPYRLLIGACPKAISPPHWSMPQAILPPHWSMRQAISPPHRSMPPAILPPHRRSWLVSNWIVNLNRKQTAYFKTLPIYIYIFKPLSSQIYKKINLHTHSMKNQHLAVLLACKTVVLKTPLVNQPVMLTSPYYKPHNRVSYGLWSLFVCQSYSPEIITTSSLKTPCTALR